MNKELEKQIEELVRQHGIGTVQQHLYALADRARWNDIQRVDSKAQHIARRLDTGTVRCPDHRGGGATRCPRGGADLQIWQRKQWGD